MGPRVVIVSLVDPLRQLSERLRVTLDLVEFGFEMKRASLRRQFPAASDEELSLRLTAWAGDRPGDGEGVPVSWPRRPR